MGGFKRWLFLSGPIGRFIQWAAKPGQKIAADDADEFLYRELGPEWCNTAWLARKGLLPLEPSGNSRKIIVYTEAGPQFEN